MEIATSARFGTSPPLSRLTRMITDLWYKNAVIYCLSVSTFMDANGDGVGDFEGLMRRLGLPPRPRRNRDLVDAFSNISLS